MSSSKQIRIAVVCPNNVEDMEFIVPVDMWRRAKFTVDVIAYDTKPNFYLSYSNLKVCSEFAIKGTNLMQYDAIYLPGGPGWRSYLTPHSIEKNEGESKLHQAIRKFFDDEKKWIIALCGAPIALMSILEEERNQNLNFTCYNDPSIFESFKKNRIDQKIVVDKNVITGQNAGCSYDIALSTIEALAGRELANDLAKKLFLDYPGMNNYKKLN